MTSGDIAILTETTRPFYDDDRVPIGTVKSWHNLDSGDGGTAKLIKRLEYKGMPCRRIQLDTKLDKNADRYHFVVQRCRAADGNWKFL